MESIDIFPVQVPSKDSDYLSVSCYLDDKGVGKDLPLNPRAIGIAQACGYDGQQFRGDVFFSRIFDDDDDWRRIDFHLKDCCTDAEWVTLTKKKRASSAQGMGAL